MNGLSAWLLRALAKRLDTLEDDTRRAAQDAALVALFEMHRERGGRASAKEISSFLENRFGMSIHPSAVAAYYAAAKTRLGRTMNPRPRSGKLAALLAELEGEG